MCSRAILRRPPYMSVTSARLPISEVNIEVTMPRVSTTAKPRIAPVPKIHSTSPAIAVVTLESAMAENAFSKPARIAAYGETPLRSSSRIRS